MNDQNEAQRIQYSIYKKMTADQKICISTNLYFTSRKLKRAALQKQYPHLSDDEIEEKLRDIFLHALT
jgi:hypothetical protein